MLIYSRGKAMKAEAVLSNMNRYFNGFHDVYEHKTLGTTFLGIVKILSYCFLIPPFICGSIYGANKKITDLQKEFDREFETDNASKAKQTQQVAMTIFPDSEKKLVQYLTDKLDNFDPSTDGDRKAEEMIKFARGFKKLSFDQQLDFFKNRTHSVDKLEMALEWIPKDITKLNFISGTRNVLSVFNDAVQNRNNLVIFLSKLPEFKQLKTIELNLQSVGFYTAESNRLLQLDVDGVVPLNAPVGGDEYMNGINWRGFDCAGFTNDISCITGTFVKVRELKQNNRDLEWKVYFANVHAGTDYYGFSDLKYKDHQGAIHSDTANFAQTIRQFMNRNGDYSH